ncbi:MAG TPA: hypothetical protein PLP26_12240 [Ilumatobacteraceae bacterium]|nr:hypothetical protein [Ilumatobacteraceae bacterium]
MLTSFEIDARLRRIARPQLGLVTIEEAAKAGVDQWALQRRRDAGELLAVFAEVMRHATVAPTDPQRILAAALAVPGSTIAATSAAVVHELPVRAGESPMLSVPMSGSARTDGIAVIRHRIELPSRRWHTGRVATPDATLVLLPRFVDASTLERCLDDALVRGLTTACRVMRLVEALPPRAVVGRRLLLELLAERLDGIGHRSRLEQRVARWLHAAGLRGWRRNYPVPVPGADPVEVDFAWTAARVALEVSPFYTHGSRAKQLRDMERRRQLVVNGWRVVEATDPDVKSQLAFRATVRSLQEVLTSPTSRALNSAERTPLHATSAESPHGPTAASGAR